MKVRKLAMVMAVSVVTALPVGTFAATTGAEGGGHASAAAPQGGHSGPSSPPPSGSSSSAAVHSAPSAAAIHSEPANANPTAAVARPPANTGTSTESRRVNASPANNVAAGQTARTHRHDFNQQYNAVYGDPWYGYSGGWNSGWYGNGYTNSGYYNDPTYTQAAPDSGNNNQSTPAVVTPPAAGQTAAGSEAQVENAADRSPELAAANDAVKSAQLAYDAERQRVLGGLNANPEYQQAVARQHDASGGLQSAKASPASMPAITEAATAKLDASDEVTKMQEQAIQTDPAAAAAKAHLAEAVAARDSLRAHLMLAH